MMDLKISSFLRGSGAAHPKCPHIWDIVFHLCLGWGAPSPWWPLWRGLWQEKQGLVLQMGRSWLPGWFLLTPWLGVRASRWGSMRGCRGPDLPQHLGRGEQLVCFWTFGWQQALSTGPIMVSGLPASWASSLCRMTRQEEIHSCNEAGPYEAFSE